ncbi:serine O-acetyltransferase [Vibrio campbellii]|uniref:Serine O-acetyltransferase n=1 Tax=Vibrio campbellii TaxID=680 RepID=A0ACC7RAZ0_9VIBR|nr:serine acetyltransferase [Vibrio campbellii]
MKLSFLRLFTTSKPKDSMELECQMMLYYSKKNRFFRKYFQRRIYYRYHCEISHNAIIPASTKFVHPIGVIIGSNAVLNENVTIYQGVTIGTNLNTNNEMPTIGSNCTICAGAKIIGGVHIGENVVVGANAVITKNIPPNVVVGGVNRIIKEI